MYFVDRRLNTPHSHTQMHSRLMRHVASHHRMQAHSARSSADTTLYSNAFIKSSRPKNVSMASRSAKCNPPPSAYQKPVQPTKDNRAPLPRHELRPTNESSPNSPPLPSPYIERHRTYTIVLHMVWLIYRSEYRDVKDESRLALHLAVRKSDITRHKNFTEPKKKKKKRKKEKKKHSRR